MTKQLIDQAIKARTDIFIEYSKDGNTAKPYQLTKISYSEKFGESYICGTPVDSDTELTFRLDRIRKVELHWNDFFDSNTVAPETGLFLMACRGDNHLVFELMKYKKGDRFWELYEGANEHYSGWVEVDPLAYHYIPLYAPENNSHWKKYEASEKILGRGIYIFAYILRGAVCQDEEISWDIPSVHEYYTQEIEGIHYSFLWSFSGMNIKELEIEENVTILACHFCMLYTEDNHAIHWQTYKEMHNEE